MTLPASPMVWPEHFPPKGRWDSFFMGISVLGPDLADVFEECNEQLGKRMKAGFWETLVDWNDKNACLRELVRKVTAELNAQAAFDAANDWN